MDSFIQFGNITLRSQWLIMAAGIAIGFFILYIRLKIMGTATKQVFQLLIDSCVYFVLVWMFSPALFHMTTVIRDPVLFLFFQGDTRSFVLGLIVCCTYLLWRTSRDGIPFRTVWASFGTVYATAGFFYFFMIQKWGKPTEAAWLKAINLEEHPVHIYAMLLFCIPLVVLVDKRRMQEEWTVPFVFFWLGAGSGILLFFDLPLVTLWQLAIPLVLLTLGAVSMLNNPLKK